MLRVWGGVRPLFQDDAPAETRDVTRAHAVLDHRKRDGVAGFLTITGGKLCTFRLMAQDVVDAVCAVLGTTRACRTADEPLPDSQEQRFYQLGSRLAERERTLLDEQLICECELVRRGRLEDEMGRRPAPSLDDLRRALRLGMGPCQGGFCMYRAAGILHQLKHLSAAEADQALMAFLEERWKGVYPLLHGDQLRQAWLDDWIFQGVLDVEHLPQAAPAHATAARADGDRTRHVNDQLSAPAVDVIVLGAGMAGLVAAIRLAEAGLRVTTVAKGYGSLRLAPATIDILGYRPDPVDSPAQALPGFAAAHPEHPYAQISPATLARGRAVAQGARRRPTPTSATPTRTCCSPRRSACPGRARWCRRPWPPVTCAVPGRWSSPGSACSRTSTPRWSPRTWRQPRPPEAGGASQAGAAEPAG